MASHQIFYVGTESEVAHHAAPLAREVDVKVADPTDVGRLARPGDLAIFFSEHFHRFRQAWFELSRKGCLTLYAIDGILEWRNAWENRPDEPACPWTMRPVLSDKVACIGPAQARVLDSWGNAGKTEIVGIPRLDSLINSSETSSRLNNRGPLRILLTTAKWPGFTPEQIRQVTRSLQDIKRYFQSNPEIDGRPVEVVWRLTGDLAEKLEVDNRLNSITGEELIQQLQSVHAVITTPSTVMLEAMLCGRPVALLDYTNSPRYVDAAWSITAREHIEPVIRAISFPSHRRMAFQNYLLRDALQVEEGAVSRIARLCHEMIRTAHDCRSANRPVEFSERILPAATPEPVLEWKQAYPGRERESIGSVEAVAAESLRRIDHLQARIELLESELARAAEGFDRIASHPVLAPLVKVRKIAQRMGHHIGDIVSRKQEDGSSQNGVGSQCEE